VRRAAVDSLRGMRVEMAARLVRVVVVVTTGVGDIVPVGECMGNDRGSLKTPRQRPSSPRSKRTTSPP
jgi:hypothetical protein